MKSIKPGRAPSWGGVIGGVVAAVFGVFWTTTAAQMRAPPFFVGFGFVFILLALGGAIYNFYNATSRNRFSEWDITGPHEERDPLDISSPSHVSEAAEPSAGKPSDSFCPSCGRAVQSTFAYCPKCGKPLRSR